MSGVLPALVTGELVARYLIEFLLSPKNLKSKQNTPSDFERVSPRFLSAFFHCELQGSLPDIAEIVAACGWHLKGQRPAFGSIFFSGSSL